MLKKQIYPIIPLKDWALELGLSFSREYLCNKAL